MTWKWPHNIQAIADTVRAAFPGIVVYGIGDAAHRLEHSDHNADSRDIVHAADIMTLAWEQAHGYSSDEVGGYVLRWLLLPANRKSLEYLIHNGKIYEEDHDWEPLDYDGPDAHTDHVHVSGKHGTTGEDAGTGTGYSTAAEAMTPTGSPLDMEDDMDFTPDNVNTIMATATMNSFAWLPAGTAPKMSLATALAYIGNAAHAAYLNTMTDDPEGAAAALAPVLAPLLAAALAPLMPSTGGAPDATSLQAAIVGALRELVTAGVNDAA